jgi:hypothetical protein
MQQQLASALNGWMNEWTNERIHLANWLCPSYCFTPTWRLVLDPMKGFFFPWRNFAKKPKIINYKFEKSDFGCFQSTEVRILFFKGKIRQIHIFGFHCFSQRYRRMNKDFYFIFDL